MPLDLIHTFRDKDIIIAFSKRIQNLAKDLKAPLRIMEVCGGHTHTLMRYGLTQMLPKNIEFIHGPGCPVCVMPKNRINQAYQIAMQENVILLTLGDMIKVPGSFGSLSQARSKGANVGFLYSPLQTLEIARNNPHKNIVFFAIGFETTTPMTAALIQAVIKEKLKNVLFHINHILVPPPVRAILDSKECAINALIAPSHASVIAGAKIYEPLARDFSIPIVVSGFEPVDMLQSLEMIMRQSIQNAPRVEIQYKRAVSMQGNLKAQKLIKKYFKTRKSFEWRGLGAIADSALELKDEYQFLDAETYFADILSQEIIADHKLCRCGDILRGVAKPLDCKVFGKSCTPSNPLGSCMVSSEGACAAYYKYGVVI